MESKEYILLIDTSSNVISVVLAKADGKYIGEKSIDSDKVAVDLPVLVESILKDIGFNKLQAIGVIVGPGSFTGIRIGIAYSKGLSLGLNIPLYSVNAFEVYLNEFKNAFVAIDTGRGDFFVGSTDVQPCVMNMDEVEVLKSKYKIVLGDKSYNLKNGINVLLEKKIKSPDIVIPLYLRPSYAEK